MSAFAKEIYVARREALKKKLGSGVVLLLGNEESSMNFRDNHYRFRQDSTFLYYFGISLPGLAAIIDIDNDREIIFGDDLSIDHIVWTGPQPTMQELADLVGVSTTLPANEVKGTLKKYDIQTIHYLPPYRPENKHKLHDWLGFSFSEIEVKISVELIMAVVAQRSVKSEEEIKEMDEAAAISADMHLTVMRNAKPGMKEYDLVAMVHETAMSAGGNLSYPAIITVNGQILHNHYYGNTLKDGQMVLVDTGAENKSFYAGDLTRTFPVSATFTPEQRDLYQIVLDAQYAAEEMLKPGVQFKDIHLAACKTLAEGLKEVGLMKGDLDDAVAQGAHAMFFQCGLGHLMGMDVHDMEDLGEQYVGYTDSLKKSTQFGLKSLRLGRQLEKGFVVTVEPGIYIIPELIDMWGKEKKFAEFLDYEKLDAFRDFGGIRIEDDYVITENGHKLLGKELAKEVKDVEALRKEALS